MTREEGLRQIEQAQWKRDEYDTLNLWVQDKQGTWIHAFLSLRPCYCDRGHIQLTIEGPLNLNLDEADRFPRYFFTFAEADKHTRAFLKWRLWKERSFSEWELRLTWNSIPFVKEAYERTDADAVDGAGHTTCSGDGGR